MTSPRAALEAAEKALEPFAKDAEFYSARYNPEDEADYNGITVADLNGAAYALATIRAALSSPTETALPAGYRMLMQDNDRLRGLDNAIASAFLKASDPGTSDLDDEQSFPLHIPLGILRQAARWPTKLSSLAPTATKPSMEDYDDALEEFATSSPRGSIVIRNIVDLIWQRAQAALLAPEEE